MNNQLAVGVAGDGKLIGGSSGIASSGLGDSSQQSLTQTANQPVVQSTRTAQPQKSLRVKGKNDRKDSADDGAREFLFGNFGDWGLSHEDNLAPTPVLGSLKSSTVVGEAKSF